MHSCVSMANNLLALHGFAQCGLALASQKLSSRSSGQLITDRFNLLSSA
jgi:hypothetical protein